MIMMAVSSAAESQSSSTGLEVSAEASLLVDTNNPRVFLTVHLVNTSDRELTVLTKQLNLVVQPSSDHLVLSIGYGDPAVTHHGHPVVPSLYDFSPVRLQPNEEALVQREVSGGLGVLGKDNDTALVVAYTVSAEWGKRFAVWSGAVMTAPFKASIKKRQSAPEPQLH